MLRADAHFKIDALDQDLDETESLLWVQWEDQWTGYNGTQRINGLDIVGPRRNGTFKNKLWQVFWSICG